MGISPVNWNLFTTRQPVVLGDRLSETMLSVAVEAAGDELSHVGVSDRFRSVKS